MCGRLQNDEGTTAGGNFQSAGGNSFAAEARQLVVFTQYQFTAVQQQGAAAHLAVAGQGINFCILGQVHGSGFCGVVDHQPDAAVLAVLAGVAVNMSALTYGIAAVIPDFGS